MILSKTGARSVTLVILGMVVGAAAIFAWPLRSDAVAAPTGNCPSPAVSNLPCVKIGTMQARDLPDTLGKIAGLPLARGKYSVSAKLFLINTTGASLLGECQLWATGTPDVQLDSAKATVPSSGTASMALIGSYSFGSAGSTYLKCATTGSNNSLTGSDIAISALKLGT